MQANLISKVFVHKYNFEVVIDGLIFNVEIYLDEKQSFTDISIKLNENELEFEGSQGQIRTKLIQYIGKNWDILTKLS